MTQYYLNIRSDLLENNPTDPIITPDPYIERRSLGTNIKMFYRMLRWSIRMNDRVGGLLNAYYLGYLLEERASTPVERRKCRKILTKHYIIACTRVYNLYTIAGIPQLYRAQRSSFWMFRKLNRREFNQLLQDAM
jgi:hypothetical protein